MRKKFFLLAILTLFLLSPTLNFGGVVFSANLNTQKLSHEGNDFVINYGNYQINSNIHTVAWQASQFSRKSSPKHQAQTIQDFLEAGTPIDIAFDFVFPTFSNKLKRIEKVVNTPSKNASLELNNDGNFQIIPEKEGLELEKNTLYHKILNNLKIENFDDIVIPVCKTEPKFKTDSLKQSTNLRSTFETDFSKSSEDRKNNIRQAISKFNGKVIYPNETLSFNETTGKRTEKNGYREAKIIVNGKYVPGVGGGVCQASTTVYNACILAGLDCQAHNHSIPPSYVSKGLDAMVNGSQTDLKITNTLSHPVFIQAYCTNEKIVVKVFGENLEGITFKTKTKILEEKPSKGEKIIKDINQEYIDKVKYKGEFFVKQRATKGYKTATYVLTFENGKKIGEKLVRKDYYPPSEGIIIEGVLDKPIQENLEIQKNNLVKTAINELTKLINV